MEQEILQTAMIMRQQSEETEKQLSFINEQVYEMEVFLEGLKELERSDKEEILANLGRGVYAKANLIRKEKLFVEVGSGVVVRKSNKEARVVIEEQLKRFREAQIQLRDQMEIYAREFRKLLREVEKLKGRK